jgi:hypothetical protein
LPDPGRSTDFGLVAPDGGTEFCAGNDGELNYLDSVLPAIDRLALSATVMRKSHTIPWRRLAAGSAGRAFDSLRVFSVEFLASTR